MDNKKIRIFNCIIYSIYILSIIFFLIKKDYSGVVLSILCLVIGLFLSKFKKVNSKILDDSLYIVSNLFVLSSFLLGSSYKLYDKIQLYDDFLHFWSGFIGVKIGWNLLNITEIIPKKHKMIFIIIILLFSMGLSAICEISEYLLDTIFKMKTQAGGLKDTMQDMIDALAGTIIMLTYFYKQIKSTQNNHLN